MQTTSTPTVALAPELAQAVHSLPASDTAAAHAPHACLNCGKPVPDRFCGHCGQDVHHTQRFSLGQVLHEVPHILHVEKGLFYTVVQLLRQPAATLHGYLAGQRQQHFKPLGFVLLTAGASSFLYLSLGIFSVSTTPDPHLPSGVQRLVLQLSNQAAQYQSWLMVGLLPFVALLSWALLRRLRLNYAEHLVLNAYITGTTTLLSLPVLLGLHYYRGAGAIETISQVSLLLALGYTTWAYGSLLKPTGRPRWRRYTRALLTTLLVLALQMVLIYAVLLALNWPLVRQTFGF